MTEEDLKTMETKVAQAKELTTTIRRLERGVANIARAKGLAVMWRGSGGPEFYFIPDGPPDPLGRSMSFNDFRSACCDEELKQYSGTIRANISGLISDILAEAKDKLAKL